MIIILNKRRNGEIGWRGWYNPVIMEKDELRAILKERIRAFPRKAEESRMIVDAIAGSSLWREAETILAFIPLPSEPDITPLLDDRRVLLPYIEGGGMHFSASRRFTKSSYGVYEPEHVEARFERALMLVPMLGFCGLQRLGRGGGFYDRFINESRGRIIAAGVAFSISRSPEIECEEHDAPLDLIFTAGA